MQLISANPLVVVMDDFASEAECAAVIEAARPRLRRATVTDDGVANYESDKRSNTSAAIDLTECPALMALCLKLAVLLRLPMSHAEHPVVLNYQPGQEFKPHLDGFSIDAASPELDAYGGQRLFTAIAYLNEPEGGGATRFPELDIGIEPRRGRLLLFANTMAGQRAATALALHAGEPVTGGEKWAVTYWWREGPAKR